MTPDLRSDFRVHLQVVDSNQTPTLPDAAPTFRVYGPAGLVGSGTCTDLLTGTITNVTNANPAVVTDADHGLTGGTVVTISGVGGATGVNGTRAITYISSSTFSVAVAAGGAYTSGGTWKVTGAYYANFDSSLRALLEPGVTYAVYFDFAVSSVQKTELQHITVL